MAFHEIRRNEFLQRRDDLSVDQLLNAVAAYEVKLEAAAVASGETYWRVAGVYHLSPDENRGGHTIYVDVVDESGQRVTDPSLRLEWGWEGQRPDEASPAKLLDKSADQPASNVDLFLGQHTWVRIAGQGLRSDRVLNLHSKHRDEPGPGGELWNSIGHHSFYVLFQRTRKGATGPVVPEPAPEPVVEEPPIPAPPPVLEPGLEVVEFPPFSHQDLINAAALAAGALGLGDSGTLLVKCGLSVQTLAADRRARYDGVPLHRLPNLSVTERNTLTEKLAFVLATMPVPPRPDGPTPPPTPPTPEPEPEPVTPPAPPPVPTPAEGNRLGFYLHLSTDQNGLWEAIRRIQPPVILIHADTANRTLLQEIRAFRAPDAFVIGRMFKDVNTQRQMLEGPDPAGAGRAMAEEIANYDFGLATQRGANGRLLIDAWMSLNEAVPGPASRQFAEQPAETARLLRAYDAFQAAFHERLRQAGIEAVAFNFGAGNFSRPEHYQDHFPQTLAAYTYLGFHEYGWPSLQPGPGTATSATLYRACMEGIRARFGNRHRAIITEAGLTRMFRDPAAGDVGWLNSDMPLTEDEYWRSLEWYNRQLSQDDHVLGACLYEVGHHGGWETFRHLGQDSQGRPLKLMERIEALSPRTRQAGSPLGPFRIAEPMPITLRGRVTGGGKPVAGATVRLVGGQETLGTMRQATANAPLSTAWTRTISGYEGSVSDAWRKFMSGGSVPLSLAQFRERVAQYNPSLAAPDATLEAERRYRLPEVREDAGEIVWDRPLTGFSGGLYACWRHYVARKVVGVTFADFKNEVVRHNLRLAANHLQFEADRRYNLPRNEGQKEYVLVTSTNTRGRFAFRELPVGQYRLEVAAEGYQAQTVEIDAQSDHAAEIDLRPGITGFVADHRRLFGERAAFDFVRVQGTEFVANGQALRFIGVNVRGLVHYGDGQTLPFATPEHRREQIRAARDLGARALRVFLPSHNIGAEETVTRLNSLIALLREEAPGMYLLPALSNLYNDVPFRVPGDDRFYERLDPNFGGELLNSAFFGGGYRDNYLPFVRHVVQAFRNETAIFAWEIGNELKLNPATGDLGADPNVAAFIAFMHDTANEIHSLDPNHLVTTGMISTHHAWLHNEELKRRLYEPDSFDFITVHCYNDELQNDDSELAARLGKPFIIEEAGYGQSFGGDRSGKVAEDMARWFSRGARGYMPWGFMATGQDIGDGDRDSGLDRTLHGDWEPLTNLLRRKAGELAAESPSVDVRPVEPRPIRPEPAGPVVPESFSVGQTVFSLDWLNVRKSPGFLNKLGDDVLGMLAPGSPVTVSGASAMQDGLTWWPIRGALPDGQPVEGWAAAANADTRLLSSTRPTTERIFRSAGRTLFAATYVNLRFDPGYVDKPSDHVIGQIPLGAKVEVLGDAVPADGLPWLPVRAPLLDNRVATGWAAEVDPNGVRLLTEEAPPDPVPFTGNSHGTAIQPGTDLTLLTVANLRPAATLSANLAMPILATLARQSHVTAISGPELAEGLEWWQVSPGIAAPGVQPGWMALAASDGTRLLAPTSVAEAIQVDDPFQIPWPVTQGWGQNPQVYSQFPYDGVPLKGHNGIDFGTEVGTPILAIDDARVIRADFEPDGFGNYVLLQHAWGESIYAHLDRIDVAVNTDVTGGQPIGVSGNTGFSTGPHLHFGIRIFPYRRTDGWGGFANPVPFMEQDRLFFPFVPEFKPSPMAPELLGRLRP